MTADVNRRRSVHGVLAALLLVGILLTGCEAQESAAAPARTVLATRVDVDHGSAVSYPGEIRARHESPLSFRVGGKLVSRSADVGSRVRQGQVLAELDPGDLRLQAQAAQAQLTAAEAELARARGDRDRYATLAAQKLISQSTMDAQTAAYKAADAQARSARANLDVARNQAAYSRLLAPADGAIGAREAEVGQVVAAGQTIFTIAADGAREVAIALPESTVRRYVVGQQATVTLWNAPDQRLQGSIREIAPAADPQSRTYATRITLPSADSRVLELGQSARVYFNSGVRTGVQVPLAAIQPGVDGGHVVWVVDPSKRTVRRQPVTIGAYGESSVPVLSGLAPDALVVAAGGQLLREGERVDPVDRNNHPLLPALTAAAATTAER